LTNSLLQRIAVDSRPLKYPDFRRRWLGQGVSFVGYQITTVAVPLQIYALTKSSLWVGLIGAPHPGPSPGVRRPRSLSWWVDAAQLIGSVACTPGRPLIMAQDDNDATLQVSVVDDAGWAILAVTGEIDISTAAAFEAALHEAMEASGRVVIDLSGVRFMDSTGLGVLMRAHKNQGEAAADSLRLAAPSERVVRVLDVTQLYTVFAVYPSVDASIANHT
jgi:anti-anti-sigma factor